jgi:hypothetical protein
MYEVYHMHKEEIVKSRNRQEKKSISKKQTGKPPGPNQSPTSPKKRGGRNGPAREMYRSARWLTSTENSSKQTLRGGV